MSVYQRILVPFEKSEIAQTALEAAVATAAWNHAEVVVLHIGGDGVDLEAGNASEELDVVELHTRRLLAAAAPYAARYELPMDRIRAEIRMGGVVEVIAAVVEELLCDLVVMGTHGRKGLVETLTGSTTEQVIRQTPASVFVVRPKGYPYLRD